MSAPVAPVAPAAPSVTGGKASTPAAPAEAVVEAVGAFEGAAPAGAGESAEAHAKSPVRVVRSTRRCCRSCRSGRSLVKVEIIESSPKKKEVQRSRKEVEEVRPHALEAQSPSRKECPQKGSEKGSGRRKPAVPLVPERPLMASMRRRSSSASRAARAISPSSE